MSPQQDTCLLYISVFTMACKKFAFTQRTMLIRKFEQESHDGPDLLPFRLYFRQVENVFWEEKEPGSFKYSVQHYSSYTSPVDYQASFLFSCLTFVFIFRFWHAAFRVRSQGSTVRDSQ